ncbi:DUF2285 domain-containing protein [Azospirillum oleiclasticum]|uniref:DUF2285 domain-containing protein n=1 Tax=Azospirillum oleiclasticum TaxID=2735135 RepID=UPI0031B5BC17
MPAPPGSPPLRAGADPLAGPGRRATLVTHEGVHVVLADGPRERRLLVEAPELPPPGTPLRAAVSFDRLPAPQIAAIGRLAAWMTGVVPPPDLTTNQTTLLRRSLQALDASLAGASVRKTAAAVFGADRVAADWLRDSPLRDRTRYLIRRGHRLMEGGYRDLLAGRPGRSPA